MRRTSYFNNIDISIFKKIGFDNLNEPITLKMLDVQRDPDNPSQPLIPAYKRIPNRDTILVDGITYDIAAIASISGDTASFYEIGFWRNEGGYKRFDPKNARQREQLEFLLISNFNGSNPLRDTSVKALFEVFRPEDKAKKSVDSRMKKIEAITLAAALSESDCREFAASVGWNESDDIYVIKDKILDWCEKDPGGFIEAQSSRDRYVLATIKRAESRGIITRNPLENAWEWSATGELVCTMPRTSQKDMYEGFLGWYMSEDRALRVFQEIESILYGRNHVSKVQSKKTEPEEEALPQSKRRRARASE